MITGCSAIMIDLPRQHFILNFMEANLVEVIARNGFGLTLPSHRLGPTVPSVFTLNSSSILLDIDS